MKNLKSLFLCFFIFIVTSCKVNYHRQNYLIEYNSLYNKFENKDALVSDDEIKKVLNLLKKEKTDSLYYNISEKTIAYYYNRAPKKALKYIKNNINYLSSSKDYKKLGINIQNASFVYADSYKNYYKSLQYCNKAIAIWNREKDSMNLANMLKYKGYLYGNLHKFPEAKIEIQQAIHIFKDLKNEKGIAVSYYNLASVFVEEKKTDSALYYFEKSKLIWKNNKGFNRIFQINNNILEIYRMKSNEEKFKEIYIENQYLIDQYPIFEAYVLDFKKINYR